MLSCVGAWRSDARLANPAGIRSAFTPDGPPRRAADRPHSFPPPPAAVASPERKPMAEIGYTWHDRGVARTVRCARAAGAHGAPSRFGADGGPGLRALAVQDFSLATTPVTQSFWAHVLGRPHRCCRTGPLLPLANVSWDELVRPDGFLARLPQSAAG